MAFHCLSLVVGNIKYYQSKLPLNWLVMVTIRHEFLHLSVNILTVKLSIIQLIEYLDKALKALLTRTLGSSSMTKITTLITVLATVLLLTFTLNSQAMKFEEGKHYTVVAEKKTLSPELSEYFSYYCPTCRAYEPYLNGFKKVMPEKATFNKVHVDFMGQTSAEIQFMLSKALIIAEKTSIDSVFSSAVFKYLQTDRATINNEKDIRNIFILSGGNAKKFDQGMKNFSVIGQAKREKRIQDKLSKSRHLTSVPTIIVNGKYLRDSKSLDRNNFFKEYNELVAYLFTL
jgi:thiol:disulfide interchange protein DsbA